MASIKTSSNMKKLNYLLNPIQKHPTTIYSLKHGYDFKKYQNKISGKYDKYGNYGKYEGFETNSDTEALQNLKTEYNNTLEEYKTLLAEITSISTDYIARVDPSNPYLNNFIQFTTGEICYVTNQGVAKYLPNVSLVQSTGVNYTGTNIKVNIPFDKSWSMNPGSNIPTNPPLISGTNIDGSQLGNEGDNVLVDRIISNTNSNYVGCYTDNSMNFVGDTPSKFINKNTNIINGNFDNPVLPTNSHELIIDTTTVPGWNFNANLMNSSNSMGYPQPYPNGNQAVSIQKIQSIRQSLNLNIGSYVLTLFACRRNCCDNSGSANPINIQLNGVVIFTINPNLASWQYFSIPFTISISGVNTLSFIGTSSTDRSTALQNIQISGARSGKYNFDSCKQSAINGGFKYFALQNIDPFLSTGYCAVSNNYTSITVEPSSSCKKMSDGNMGGTQDENALYKMDDVGIPGNIGKKAYINEDSKLYPYPDTKNHIPPGIPDTTPITIDSNEYQNYSYGGSMDKTKFGLAKMTSVQQGKLTQIEAKLNDLSQQMNDATNNFKTTNNSIYTTLYNNTNNATNNLDQISSTNPDYSQQELNNITNRILDDSKISVSQKNTNYIFLSVIAVTALLVSIYILRK
jgi:hypothetical protein